MWTAACKQHATCAGRLELTSKPALCDWESLSWRTVICSDRVAAVAASAAALRTLSRKFPPAKLQAGGK